MKSSSSKAVALLVILLALAGGIAYWATRPANDSTSTPVISPTPTPSSDIESGFTGEFVCLPHRDTSGPQTLECAMGLKADDGTYYGLQDTTNDYSLLAGVATGSRVRVEGPLQEIAGTTYPTAGIIRVTKLEKL